MSNNASCRAHNDIDEEDAIAIGLKVVEMAERVRTMHLACPGSVAKWAFEMDDTRYVVRLSVATHEDDPQ